MWTTPTNDAAAFRRFLVTAYGIDEQNVIDLRDATRAQMDEVFGGNDHGLLWRHIDPNGCSEIVVFYSGHSTPDASGGSLWPADADPGASQSGTRYPIDLLLARLTSLEAAGVRVFLDAGFLRLPAVKLSSGGVADRLVVLTAAADDQLASWDERAGRGLFTKYMLRALYGEADANRDGAVSLRETKEYLDEHMTKAAQRLFGRGQRAGVYGSQNTVLNFVRRPLFESGEDWISEVRRGPQEEEFCARPNVQCASHPTYEVTLRGFSERDALLLVSRMARFPGYDPDRFWPKKLPAILSRSPSTIRVQYPSQAKAAKLAEWLNMLLPIEGLSARVDVDGLEVEITAAAEAAEEGTRTE